ncbi:MAG: ATP-binding protein [Euryarchaeota archaeon TMED129]|nr:MAG: ATP-binding protein [Euryarchaeota archaeon TMED129]|tara:strand:+ start:5450 stop:6811 length:1362 start_codon:yes stop_codon:yes gene_type:complete
MFNAESLQEKWNPILEHNELDPIKDTYRKAVTSVLLENQEKFLKEERGLVTEAAPTNSLGGTGFSGGSTATGPVAGFDPVLISLIRRSMPKLIAYDICGVQPMTGPTGLIFAMRSTTGTNRDINNSGVETFFNEVNSEHSSENSANGLASNTQTGSNPGLLADGASQYTIGGQGMTTAQSEALGDGSSNHFNEMGFSIEKVTVTAKSRALKAEYSLELAQDLKAVHGLDAESELANILSTEVLAEINREVVRTVYKIARPGAQNNTATAGVFDLDVDSNGRWSVEKFKGLLFQIERDMNAIGHETRRGKGNILICSADVASALSMAGVLDYTPALSGNSNLLPDDNSSTLAGTLNGRIKVYVDPYSANVSDAHFYVAGYKGSSAYDAGLFYCPYVPLQMVRAVGPDTFQPKIGFKTRYGMVANPFAEGLTQGQGALTANANRYYRRVKVTNLM